MFGDADIPQLSDLTFHKKIIAMSHTTLKTSAMLLAAVGTATTSQGAPSVVWC